MTREQFTFCVKSTQRTFRRFLVALCCGDVPLAEDIAQEAYMKAYLTCGSFHHPEKFIAWIHKIGYHTFLNHKRTERRTVDYDEVPDIPANDTSDAAFHYQALYDALNELPPKERTSILLFYMEDYSVKEIAEIVEVSSDAVKQHLTRGRKHLRNILTTQK